MCAPSLWRLAGKRVSRLLSHKAEAVRDGIQLSEVELTLLDRTHGGLRLGVDVFSR
jgi:hypothetical protein